MTAAAPIESWSVNRRAAKAVVWATQGAPVDQARELLDMLGLIDGPDGREVLPDDVRHLDLGDLSIPTGAARDLPEPRGSRLSTPPGLRDLAPRPASPTRKGSPVSAPAMTSSGLGLQFTASDSTAARLAVGSGPYITALPIRDLFTDPTYQRPLDEARVAAMARTWEPRMLGVLDVSDRGPDASPRYAIINGQHRAAAAARATSDTRLLFVVCNVHEGLDPAGEARLMFDLDRSTKALTSWDKWRSRRAAGDPIVAAVEDVARGAGMTVQPGSFGAVGAAEKLVKAGGRELLQATVTLLVGAYGPSPAAMQAPNALRQVDGGALHAIIRRRITALYNRTPGEGAKLAGGRP